jgi:ribosomal protein S25
MTSKKQGNALGKGLDALIRPNMGENVKKEKAEKKSKPKAEPRKTRAETAEKTPETGASNDSDFDEKLVETVMQEVAKNPRISLWSAKSAAVLRYLKNTKPAFSISKEASALIEDAVKDKYPELWKLFEEEGL